MKMAAHRHPAAGDRKHHLGRGHAPFDATMAFFFFHTRAWELFVGAAIAIFALDSPRIGRGLREGLSAAGYWPCAGSLFHL